MALAPVTIRQAVASAIDAAIGADGWRESPWGYDLFGRSGRELSHREYAVGVPRTEPVRRDEQRRTPGALVVTYVSVRWSYALRADGQVVDYDAALAAEAALLEALLGVTTLRPELLDVRRTAAADGVLLTGQIDLAVPHLWTIESA